MKVFWHSSPQFSSKSPWAANALRHQYRRVPSCSIPFHGDAAEEKPNTSIPVKTGILKIYVRYFPVRCVKVPVFTGMTFKLDVETPLASRRCTEKKIFKIICIVTITSYIYDTIVTIWKN